MNINLYTFKEGISDYFEKYNSCTSILNKTLSITKQILKQRKSSKMKIFQNLVKG